MIISENRAPSLEEFQALMRSTDIYLNSDAQSRQNYYEKRTGTQLEFDVFEALQRCSQRTPFENTIQLVSGASFPDIVAGRFYGVEVKSTIKNQWKSIGSSILESTRNHGVERIYLTFGKLGKPVSFKSRPYEECLSGIVVTHYPRYQIDMELSAGETIFDKMGITYDNLRQMENPVLPVAKYYKSRLKPGESLWWAADTDIESTGSPPIIRLWTSLDSSQKNYFTVQAYALFPEILGSSSIKYQRYALWLASQCGIVNTNIRDQFSAGGKVDISTSKGVFRNVPAVFGRISKNSELIKDTILHASEESLQEYWHISQVFEDRLEQWCELASSYTEQQGQTYGMLCALLNIEPR